MATQKRIAMQQVRAKEELEARVAALEERVAALEAVLTLPQAEKKSAPAGRKSK